MYFKALCYSVQGKSQNCGANNVELYEKKMIKLKEFVTIIDI